MTNEEAAAMLESMKNYFLPTSPMLEERIEITAIDLAISALSKQSASSEQADKSVIVDFMAFQRERLERISFDERTKNTINGFIRITGKAFIDVLSQTATNDEDRTTIDIKKRTITERLIIAESLINSVIADSDQFREVTKKTEDVLLNRYDVIEAVDRHTREDGTLDDDISCILEEVSHFEQKKSNSFPEKPPKDGESEMNCSDVPVLIDLAEAIEIVNFECGEWKGLARTIINGIKKLSPKQSEKIPYKKPEIIRCKDCKYSVDEYSEGDCYCRRPKKGIDYIGNWNFYCADAERRNDG